MNKYEKPNLERPVEELKKEIKEDFNKMAREFHLPKELQFDAVVQVVKGGMTSRIHYPFRTLQNKFTEYITGESASSANDGENEKDINEALQIFVAVWNHFPHDDLGMSPMEKMREEQKENPEAFREPSMEGILENLDSEEYHQELDEKILSLSDVSKKSFGVHLQSIGGTKKDLETIIVILENPTKDPGDALMYMMKAVIKNSKKNKRNLLMEETQRVVRSLAMCENHIASKISNGHYNSRMFQEVAHQSFVRMAEALENEGEIIEPTVPFDILGHAHAFIAKEGCKLNVCEELKEAAHHILDWTTLIDINEIMVHEPREVALLMLGVAHLISKAVEPNVSVGCSAGIIQSAISGMMENDVYEKGVKRLAENALCNCNDPFLMIANLIDVPDDWESRLYTIAPCLKLRSPIQHTDLPIPSPF